jgi:signal transduction histidine kinase
MATASGKSMSLPSLKRQLLWGFALIATGAISLAVVTAGIGLALPPGKATLGLVLLIVADVAVLFLFSRHLLTKLVLRPVADLAAAADAVSAGNLGARAGQGTTSEFAFLAERVNRMTDRLLAMRDEVIRAEKLASVGRLAAGIAHEVGNPVAAINTYIEVLRRQGVDVEVLNEVENETERIDQIIKGLLSYARPHDEMVGTVDVGSVIRTVLDLLEAQGVLSNVEVRREIAEDLPLVPGRAHALEQMFVNLMLNAIDASHAKVIAIGASRNRHSAQAADARGTDSDVRGRAMRGEELLPPLRSNLEEGTRGVLAWVSDSGDGIPVDDRERVFDPFYTTKEPGRGTGLGLAIVHRTVSEMGGLVWVDDAREGGASFKIFLPEAR